MEILTLRYPTSRVNIRTLKRRRSVYTCHMVCPQELEKTTVKLKYIQNKIKES